MDERQTKLREAELKIFPVFAVLTVSVFASACESMSPATYSNYADNVVALRNYEDTTVAVSSMVDNSEFNAACRLVGNLETSGDRTIAEFIQDAFNAEFVFADVYSEDATANSAATLDEASYSSIVGWWEFTLTLVNPANQNKMTVTSRYEYTSGISAITACINSSQAINPAVQQLIHTTVTDPRFRALLGQEGQPAS